MSKFQAMSSVARSALVSAGLLAAPPAPAAEDPAGTEGQDPPAGDPPADPPADDQPAGDPPAEDALANPPAPSAAGASSDQPTAADVVASFQAGADAERARTNAVMTSPIGQANLGAAAWLLNANPSASSDDVIKLLGDMPGAAKPGAAGAIANTGIDLPAGTGKEASDDTAKGAWDDYYKSNGSTVAAPRVSPEAAAAADGAGTVQSTVFPAGY